VRQANLFSTAATTRTHILPQQREKRNGTLIHSSFEKPDVDLLEFGF
jgi:hypothetical protein